VYRWHPERLIFKANGHNTYGKLIKLVMPSMLCINFQE